MLADMSGLFRVIEVANRASHSIAVFKQIPNDMVADVSVDTRDKNPPCCSVRHMDWPTAGPV